MNHREFREAYVELCRGIDVQYFVTLATNRDGTIGGARKLAKDYCARIDRKLLGHEWTATPANERTDGVFFVEHVASNIHLHGLLKFPKGTPEKLKVMSGLIWKKLCPAGTVDFQSIYDLPGALRYVLKEQKLSHYEGDQLFLARDLMSEAAHQTI